MSRAADVMRKFNQISESRLLWTHAVIGLLVAFSHGSLLLLVGEGKVPIDDLRFTYITIPLALIVLVTAIAAIARTSLRTGVLKWHAVILGVAWFGAMYFSIRIAAVGIPQGVNFVWNPVVFAFVVGYPVYLTQRAFPQLAAHHWAVVAPLWAVAGSILLSAVVMWRMGNVAT
jgi:hypothetical protein